MTLTVLHQVGAAVWAGGLISLGALWRLGRRDAGRGARSGRRLVARFSASRSARSSALCLVAAAARLGLRRLVGRARRHRLRLARRHQGAAARRRARARGGQPRRRARRSAAAATAPPLRARVPYLARGGDHPGRRAALHRREPVVAAARTRHDRRARHRGRGRRGVPAEAGPRCARRRSTRMLAHHAPIRTPRSAASARTPPTPGRTSATTSPGSCCSP